MFNLAYLWYWMTNTTEGIIVLCVTGLITLIVSFAFLPKAKKNSPSPSVRNISRFLHFDIYLVQKLLKFIFILVSAFLLVFGIYLMFAASFLAGLETIAYIIVLRLAIEVVYVLLAIRDQLVQINGKTSAGSSVGTVPSASGIVCKNCGAPITQGSKFCIGCGTTVE